jgi:hypothetical protein
VRRRCPPCRQIVARMSWARRRERRLSLASDSNDDRDAVLVDTRIVSAFGLHVDGYVQPNLPASMAATAFFRDSGRTRPAPGARSPPFAPCTLAYAHAYAAGAAPEAIADHSVDQGLVAELEVAGAVHIVRRVGQSTGRRRPRGESHRRGSIGQQHHGFESRSADLVDVTADTVGGHRLRALPGGRRLTGAACTTWPMTTAVDGRARFRPVDGGSDGDRSQLRCGKR